MQIVKRGLRKVTQGYIHSRIAKVLFAYRILPQSTTGVAPTELLLGRKVRTRLDLVKLNLAERRVEKTQEAQKRNYDKTAKARSFIHGDFVYVRDYIGKNKWLQAKIVDHISGQMFNIRLTL